MDKSAQAEARFRQRHAQLAEMAESVARYAVSLVGEPTAALYVARIAGTILEIDLHGGPSRRRRGDAPAVLRHEMPPRVHRALVAEPDDDA